MNRLAGVAFAAIVSVVASAHVGSPDVLFEGTAGPYPVRVVVRPPEVVPGLAEVVVRTDAADVQSVLIRPVFWKAGAAGAPAGDDMKRVSGQDRTFSGQLWLMAYGSYSVYVTVTGARGSGTAIVPVASFATGRLAIPRGLGAILIVLGGLLFVGFLTIVRAASGESLVSPDDVIDAPRRRRANLVTVIAAPVLALVVFGGAKWWGAEDGRYQRNMYRSPAAVPTVVVDATHRTLHLNVRDTASFRAIFVPVAPDHGKMMHLFLVDTHGMNAFAHLHPTQGDSGNALGYTAEVPALPAGNYRIFGDITLENGLSLTVTNTVDIPALQGAVTPSDPDDAWSIATNVPRAAAGASVAVGDGYTMSWTGDASMFAKTPVDLRFSVRDSRGALASLQPYLGMAAHAVVIRADQSVFIHLHPMGTVATAAQQIFAARDRGDTTDRGHLSPDALRTQPMAMAMSGDLSFPYEFPKAGRYRIWVQAKLNGRVLTGTFDVDVH